MWWIENEGGKRKIVEIVRKVNGEMILVGERGFLGGGCIPLTHPSVHVYLRLAGGMPQKSASFEEQHRTTPEMIKKN